MDGYMNGFGNGNYPNGGMMQGYGAGYYNPDVFHGAAAWFVFFFGLFALLAIAVTVFLSYRILTKAGYSGWLALLALVPFGFFVIMLILAFDTWPSATSSFSPVGSTEPPKRVAKMTFAEPVPTPVVSSPSPAPAPAAPAPTPEVAADAPTPAPEIDVTPAPESEVAPRPETDGAE